MAEVIRDALRNFILENFLQGEDPGNLKYDTDLKEGGVLDSLSTLKLVTFIEDTFKVELDAHDLSATNLATLESIERLILSKTSD